MTEAQKNQILLSVNRQLITSQTAIKEKATQLNELIDKLRKGLLTWYRSSDDAEVVNNSIAKAHIEISQLKQMSDSPYFFRAEMRFSDETNSNPVYISKYSLPEERIYSWVSPVARIRFSGLGNTSYTLPSGRKREGSISRLDHYQIRAGKFVRIDYEAEAVPRTVLFEDKLEEQAFFGLTEIIEKLDAYQDDIIRIEPKGSLLISGPAGSGKTTLALHKLAYLAQNPETAPYYRPKDILIFVQDASTQAYFSSVMPGLGLKAVKLTTFAEWSMNKLGLNQNKTQYTYIKQGNHPHQQLLIYAKHKALKKYSRLIKSADIYAKLDSAYFDFLDENSFSAYKAQKTQRQLDRFDLTLLLKDSLRDKENKELYNMIVVDEAENYLAEQLSLLQRFRAPETNSAIYIGDLVQQTLPFTIKSWKEAGEYFSPDRLIVIPKVYRITRQVRDYLISKGYPQDSNTLLREGPEVIEYNQLEPAFIAEQVRQLVSTSGSGIIGVISNDQILLDSVQQEFAESPENLHFLNIHEAQGVEFDTVCLLFRRSNPNATSNWPSELQEELAKVEHDLFLVGVTRTRKGLMVFRD